MVKLQKRKRRTGKVRRSLEKSPCKDDSEITRRAAVKQARIAAARAHDAPLPSPEQLRRDVQARVYECSWWTR